MTKETGPCGSQVLVPVICAFAEMPSDVHALAGVIAPALVADHTRFFSTGAVEAKGMYKQHIRTVWAHAAHRGWARLLLNRRRDLVYPGQLAAQVANSMTRSSSGKTATSATSLNSSTLAPPT